MNASSQQIASSTGADEIGALMTGIGKAALEAARVLAQTTAHDKNRALQAAADAIRTQCDAILAANAEDMRLATERGLSGAMLDRLKLDVKRVEAMARGIEEIIGLADPIGAVIAASSASSMRAGRT